MASSTQHDNFNHLSVKDLIEARDQFHAHLINKRNVVATAIGRYLIRTSEIDENGKYKPHKKKTERTIDNSVVIDISSPCILVFIENWEKNEALIEDGVSNIVPKMIYMPDGRIVPVCVVVAPKVNSVSREVDFDKLHFPSNFFGAGFPAIVHSQGQENVATIGGIVSDGHKYYALTNKHASGNAGEIVHSLQGINEVKIGASTGTFLGKKPFNELYKGWQNNNMLVTCDTGLIEIDDIRRWKTELPFIKVMDEMFDLNTLNISLSLIAEHSFSENKLQPAQSGKVVGYGAVSGLMHGEILAMFYRHKSVGGVEYVSDFLITGRDGKNLNVHYGDSGTLWLIETMDENKNQKLQPIALHWGQHQFLDKKSKANLAFSLSTCLSNICRELDVDLVRGWNIDSDYSWGKVGHYTVGNKAISMISNGNLRTLMEKNEENISFRESDINADLGNSKIVNPRLSKDPTQGFCALADVPDIIWKQYKLSADGTKGSPWGRKGDENPNHYADADAPTVNGGKTLYDICDSQDKMTVEVWQAYYQNIDKEKIGLSPSQSISEGLVCFRVWQIFDYMVDAANAGDKAKFVFAAGVLAHYVGDACQPLHSSYMSDGNPADNVSIMYTPPRGGSRHPKGIPYPKIDNPGKGVHVAYEDHMIDDFIGDILLELNDILKKKTSDINKETIMKIDSGQAAAFAILQLMRLTQKEISPVDIVEAFKNAKNSGTDVTQTLFDEFNDRTANVIARGCRYLAAIWDGAWKAGTGDSKIRSLTTVKEEQLIALYSDPQELPSMHLDTIKPLLKHIPGRERASVHANLGAQAYSG